MTGFVLLCTALQAAQPAAAPSPPYDGIQYLLTHQGSDGSWGGRPLKCTCPKEKKPDPYQGGDVESTAWAILCLAWAGYSELSADEMGGRKVADTMRSALDWLVSKQGKDGAFEGGQTAQAALAAFALLETYGMTVRRKESAERAYLWIAKASPTDTLGWVRVGMAIESAKLDELGSGHDGKLLEIASVLERQEGELAKAGSQLLRGFAWPKGVKKPEVDYDAFAALKASPEALFVFTSGSCEMDGGERWHRWFPGMSKDIEPLQAKGKDSCSSGSWDADSLRERIRTTAIRSLTLMHYRCFHCRNPFRSDK